MNKIIYFGLVSFLLFAMNCGLEDEPPLDPTKIFIKYYGSDRTEVAIDLLEVKNAGGESQFLILGSRKKFSGSVDFILIKTDAGGNKIWELNLKNELWALDSNNPNKANESLIVVNTPSTMRLYAEEKKVMIVGTAIFDTEGIVNAKHALIMDVDVESGTVDRSLMYRYYSPDKNSEKKQENFVNTTCRDIIPFENDFILIGSCELTVTQTSATTESGIILSRLKGTFSRNDTLLAKAKYNDVNDAEYTREDYFTWEKRTDFTGNEYGYRLIEANGRYYYLGNIDPKEGYFGGTDVIVVEFEPQTGSENDRMVTGSPDHDLPSNIIFDDAGNLRIAGTTTSLNGNSQNAFEIHTGLQLSHPKYVKYSFPNGENNEWNVRGIDLVRSQFGYLFMIGEVKAYTSAIGIRENEIILIPADAESVVQVDQIQVMGSKGSDQGNAIIIQDDGSLVIAATVDFGGVASMISLIKTNSKGVLQTK